MVKPLGALSLSSGSLSAATGIGGGAIGASFWAAAVSGRPINGEPGGNGAGCWAAGGAAASKLPSVPASTSAERRDTWVMMILPFTADLDRALSRLHSSRRQKPPSIAAHRNLLHIVSVPA